MHYRLGEAVATRRAAAASAVGAVTSLAPLILAVVLVHKLGWRPWVGFWGVAVALALVVGVRAVVAYRTMSRRLRAFEVTVTDDMLLMRWPREALAIARASVARITEVDGPLGGLKVESVPDAQGVAACVIHVPRGGEAYGSVRKALEGWRRIERRGRRGRGALLVTGVVVVAAIFFVPFLLEDVVGRSRILAVALVVGMGLTMRMVVRGR